MNTLEVNPELKLIENYWVDSVTILKMIYNLRIEIIEAKEFNVTEAQRLETENENFVTALSHLVNYGLTHSLLELEWRRLKSNDDFPSLNLATHCKIVSQINLWLVRFCTLATVILIFNTVFWLK